MVRGRKPQEYSTCKHCGAPFKRWRTEEGKWTLARCCFLCRFTALPRRKSVLQDTIRRAGIVRARLHNPRATLQQIGNKHGVTRERVRQILSEEQLPTIAIIERTVISCLNCGKETANQKFCDFQCRKEYHTIEVMCSQCGKIFLLRQSELVARTKRNISDLIFCSNQCQGKWLGTRYGWGRKKVPVC